MQHRIASLDVLRAVAVLGVVTTHTSAFTMSKTSSAAGLAISTIFSSGRLGVEVFFFMSGFLLSTIYESNTLGPKDYSSVTRVFVAARFFRIWPLWIAFAVIWSGIYMVEGKDLNWIAQGVLLSLLFCLWVSPLHYDSFLPGSWSIQIEVILYCIFWLLKGRSLRFLVAVVVSVNILGVLVSTADLGSTGILESVRRLTLNTGVNFFILGQICARLSGDFLSDASSRVLSLKKAFGTIEVWLITLWLISFLFSPALYGNPIEAIGFLCLSIFVSTVLLRSEQLKTVFGYIGRRSYFVFFAHFVVLHLVSSQLSSPTSDWIAFLATPVTMFTVLGICLLFSEVSFRVFERPLMRFARSITRPS